jgi:superfamily II RNA helicase
MDDVPTLLSRLPMPEDATPDLVLERFLEHVTATGLSLYPAQEEAILELFSGKNVILNTPTGSGKSLVALALQALAVSEDRRCFYTSPIKALVSEKFFALARDLGPDNVGMMTGDATINHDAPVICCTAEILSNIALREGDRADVDYAVLDEFHYYSDRDRGVAWQVPLLCLPQTRFLLMSATLGDTAFFERALTDLNGMETVTVRSNDRPVPLHFEYRETPLHETIADLTKRGRIPAYVVGFTQRAAAEEAQNLMSVDICTKEEKRAIHEALVGAHFTSPYGKEMQKYLRHGIGVHHAGLLPRYRLLVEKLAQKGLLKLICGTDTLGVGVNIPIRTVLFTKLCKYDGEKTAILSVRDFQQISGRAGRKGFDDEGTVAVQAPEHVIENLKLDAKAGNDPAKKRKIVRKKPPEKGYVHWDRSTFERLMTSPPEPLVSRFQISHSMLLEVLAREEGGCRAMKDLVRDCHETKHGKKQLARTGKQLFRSLVEGGIITFPPPGERGLRISADLGEDFSMNQTLALYLLDTVEKLDPVSPTYALDVVTLVESILEDPDLILLRQLDRLKTETLAELKAKGVEYEDRMEELSKLEYPKPMRDLIYDSFNAFARKHPWVGQENIRPKSVAREMYEQYLSFADYIKEYDLHRSEGLLLRYLSDVYKTLAQTVPSAAKTEEVQDIAAYLGGIVRTVDASLLEEWEKMRDPARLLQPKAPVEEKEEPHLLDPFRDRRAFMAVVRGDMFRLVRAIAKGDFAYAAEIAGLPAGEVEALAKPYVEEHGVPRTDSLARSPTATRVLSENEAVMRLEHLLYDEEGSTGWALSGEIDLLRSRDEGKAVFRLERIST